VGSVVQPPAPAPSQVVLTRALVESINAAYESHDSRKMRKVLLHKLDGLTSVVAGGDRDKSDKDGAEGPGAGGRHGHGDRERETRGHGTGGQLLSGIGNLASGLGIGGGSTSGPAAVLEGTMDLEEFVRIVVSGRSKDGYKTKDRDAGVAASVRSLWSGRVWSVIRMRERERERTLSFGRSLKGDPVYSEGERESDRAASDVGKSTEDESEARPWAGRVQRKIEAWAG